MPTNPPKTPLAHTPGNQTRSQFKVYHLNNACLGVATMTGNVVRYKCDPTSYGWLEQRPHDWLLDFQTVVRRLCRSVGHASKFSISEDETTKIRVERL